MKALKVQIKQILSLRLLMAAFVFAAITGLAGSGFLDDSSSSVWYVLVMSNSSGITFFSMYMLPPMVFSWTLADEWISQEAFFQITRTGIRKYALSKFISAAIGGFFCVFAGYVILVMALSFICPLYSPCSTNPYDTLMEEGYVFMGFLLFMADISLSGAITGVFGMLCSTYVISPLTAIAAPLITNLAISRVIAGVRLPRIFDPIFWMHFYNETCHPSDALVKKGAVCIPVLIVMIIIGVERITRRIRYD